MSFEIEDHYAILTSEWVLERFPATNEHHAGRLWYARISDSLRRHYVAVRFRAKEHGVVDQRRAGRSFECDSLAILWICDAIELTVPNDDRSEYGDLWWRARASWRSQSSTSKFPMKCGDCSIDRTT